MYLIYFFFTLFTFCFFLGIVGCFFIRHNVLILLIVLEFLLLCLNMLFILASCYLDDIIGFFFSFIIITVAGVDAAFGLSLVILFFRLRGTLNIRYFTALKG